MYLALATKPVHIFSLTTEWLFTLEDDLLIRK